LSIGDHRNVLRTLTVSDASLEEQRAAALVVFGDVHEGSRVLHQLAARDHVDARAVVETHVPEDAGLVGAQANLAVLNLRIQAHAVKPSRTQGQQALPKL
jgi:hypothetical protein